MSLSSAQIRSSFGSSAPLSVWNHHFPKLPLFTPPNFKHLEAESSVSPYLLAPFFLFDDDDCDCYYFLVTVYLREKEEQAEPDSKAVTRRHKDPKEMQRPAAPSPRPPIQQVFAFCPVDTWKLSIQEGKGQDSGTMKEAPPPL